MKRSNSRIELIVLFLFASLLMMFNAYPVISHAALVELDVLNATVCQGDLVEVEIGVDPDAPIGEHDKLQLCQGEIVVSEVDLEGMREGTVVLETGSDTAPGEFAVVYVQCETGEVLGTAEETVVVLSEAICGLIEVAEALTVEATSPHRKEYLAEFISMLKVMPNPEEYVYQNLVWSLSTIAFHIIDETQSIFLHALMEPLEELPVPTNLEWIVPAAAINYGKPIMFMHVLKKLSWIVAQYAPPAAIEPDEIIIESIPFIVSTINEIVQVDFSRIMLVLKRTGPVTSLLWLRLDRLLFLGVDEPVSTFQGTEWDDILDETIIVEVSDDLSDVVLRILNMELDRPSDFERLLAELVRVMETIRRFYLLPWGK